MNVTNEMKQWARAAAPDVPGDMIDHILQAALSAGPDKCRCAPLMHKTDPGCPIHSPVEQRSIGAQENAEFENWRNTQIDVLVRNGYTEGAEAFRNLGSVQWAGWQARAQLPAATCPGHGRPECATCCFTAVDMGTAAADGYRDGAARVAELEEFLTKLKGEDVDFYSSAIELGRHAPDGLELCAELLRLMP